MLGAGGVLGGAWLVGGLSALARETEVVFSPLGHRITILGASAVLLQQVLGVTLFR